MYIIFSKEKKRKKKALQIELTTYENGEKYDRLEVRSKL